MTNTPEEFARELERWKREKDMPWGRLRYDTARMNIARHTGDGPLRILDVGGGDGMDANYYARQGHQVTLTDCSASMLSEARKFAEAQGVASLVKTVRTSQDAPLDIPDDGPYDLILCNMMLKYTPDPQAVLEAMCARLTPGGLLSITDSNRYSDAYFQAILMDDLPAAIEAVGRKEYMHTWVNRVVPGFCADDYIDRLAENGCTLAGQYGIQNVIAYLPNEPKFDPAYFEQLKELEYKLTDQYPYYLLARVFQVIGRREVNK